MSFFKNATVQDISGGQYYVVHGNSNTNNYDGNHDVVASNPVGQQATIDSQQSQFFPVSNPNVSATAPGASTVQGHGVNSSLNSIWQPLPSAPELTEMRILKDELALARTKLKNRRLTLEQLKKEYHREREDFNKLQRRYFTLMESEEDASWSQDIKVERLEC